MLAGAFPRGKWISPPAPGKRADQYRWAYKMGLRIRALDPQAGQVSHDARNSAAKTTASASAPIVTATAAKMTTHPKTIGV
jgi:hypothetical protein